MANGRYTLIQESLKRLLQEGCKYLHAANEYYHRARNDYSEFQGILHIMDSYSRHQAVLKNDIEQLNETLSLLEDSDYDDYENDYDYDYDYDEDVETDDDEETLSTDEVHNSYDEWVDRFALAIRDRQNVMTKLELMLLEKVDSYGKRMMLDSQLNELLQNYCGRVVTVLKQITSVESRLKKDTRLAKRFREKRKKLEEILVHIAEKQKFFWGASVNWNNIEAEE